MGCPLNTRRCTCMWNCERRSPLQSMVRAAGASTECHSLSDSRHSAAMFLQPAGARHAPWPQSWAGRSRHSAAGRWLGYPAARRKGERQVRARDRAATPA